MEGANVRTMAQQERELLTSRAAELQQQLDGPRGKMPHLRAGIEHQLQDTRVRLSQLDDALSQRPVLSSHDDSLALDDAGEQSMGLGL
jgi:hypothetical protein